jgi:hypothetical protein
MRRDGGRPAEIDAVARYVDSVVRGEPTDQIEVDSGIRAVVASARAELRSREPGEEFVGTLRLRLIAAADQRVPLIEETPAAWRQPRYIAIGAAGLVSAAAVIAFVARSRIQARPAA